MPVVLHVIDKLLVPLCFYIEKLWVTSTYEGMAILLKLITALLDSTLWNSFTSFSLAGSCFDG